MLGYAAAIVLAVQGVIDEFGDLLVIIGARPSRAKLVVQSLNAPVEEPAAPFAHRRGRDIEALSDRGIGQTFGAGQDDAGALDEPVGH